MNREIVARNNVRISGRGSRPMIFAHGFGCDQSMWRFVVPAFEDDYEAILFDYVGSGRSDLTAYSDKRYSELNGYAEDVLEICDGLELKDVIFVGHSVSSMIGALASIKRPELFKHLIMLVPSPCYINQPPDYRGGFERSDLEGLLDLMEKNDLGWASFLAPVVMKNDDRPELGDELEKSFCSMDPRIARQFAKATFFSDNRSDLQRVTTPTLIIQTNEDDIAPPFVGQYIHDNLPQSFLRSIDATGHCPQMSHPAETIANIKDYLDRAGI